MIDGSSLRPALGALALIAIACLNACSDRERFESELGREVAEHLCSIQADCDCDADRLIPECDAEVEREVGRNESEAIRRGLVFDPECLEAFLENIDALGSCERVTEWQSESCAVYHGAADVGDPCSYYEFYPPMTDCRPGLYCREGVCLNLQNPTALEKGDICYDPQGITPSGYLGQCIDGLACDSRDTRTCIPYSPPSTVTVGGECAEFYLCERGTYCRPPEGADDVSEEAPGICTVPTLAGQPCSLIYECDWLCEAGICQPPPVALCGVLDGWQTSRELLNDSAAP